MVPRPDDLTWKRWSFLPHRRILGHTQQSASMINKAQDIMRMVTTRKVAYSSAQLNLEGSIGDEGDQVTRQ